MVEKQPVSHLGDFPACFGRCDKHDPPRESDANFCSSMWSNLPADWIASTRLDLTGQSVLEAEVLLWRVAHQRLQ
jgi:hypothetical protein